MPTSALSHMGDVEDATAAKAREILAAVEAAGHSIHHVWGRGSSAEHATGRALDFMVYERNAKGVATGIDEAAGDFIAEYVWKHRERLGLVHVIWKQRIRSTVVSPGVWRAMADRGSPTNNHMDHPHLLFADGPYRPLNDDDAASAIPEALTKPKPSSRKPSSSKVKAPAFPLPRGHAFGPATGPKWQHSGYYALRDRQGLRLWQTQMRKRGWDISTDGLYGPQTAAVAKAFQREKGLTPDALIGAATWRAAWEAPVT